MNDSQRIAELQARVHELEARVGYMMRHLQIDHRPTTVPALDQASALLRAGNKLEAIQVYRVATGVDLRTARDVVERLEQSLGIR